MAYRNIPKFVKDLRYHNGLSQLDLALELDITQGYISMIEGEKCEASDRFLDELHAYCLANNLKSFKRRTKKRRK